MYILLKLVSMTSIQSKSRRIRSINVASSRLAEASWVKKNYVLYTISTYSNKTLFTFYFLPPNSPDNACPIFANGFDEFEDVALLGAFVILPAAPPAGFT